MLIMAIGNGGCNVADTLCDTLPEGSYKLAMLDTDSKELQSHKATGKAAALLTGDYAEIETGMAQFLTCSDTNYNKVAVIVCLGGEAGSRLAPIATRMAGKVAPCVRCVALMPFEFEGKGRRARAEAALSEIRKCAIDVVVINNDEMLGKFPDLTICDVFRQIDLEAIKAIFN